MITVTLNEYMLVYLSFLANKNLNDMLTFVRSLSLSTLTSKFVFHRGNRLYFWKELSTLSTD